MSYEKAREAFYEALHANNGKLPCQQPDVDPNDWFTEPNSPREVIARKRCLQCPIYWECQDYARDAGVPYGTWGGMDQRTRARLWRGLPGGKPSHFNDEMDAATLPLLQARRDYENFDFQHDDEAA